MRPPLASRAKRAREGKTKTVTKTTRSGRVEKNKVIERQAKSNKKGKKGDTTTVSFLDFPAEIRNMIYIQSLLRPGVHYFQACLDLGVGGTRFSLKPRAGQGADYSVYRHRRNLETLPGAKETMKLATTEEYSYLKIANIDATVDMAVDLLVFVFRPNSRHWNWFGVGAPYSQYKFGGPIRRVGLEWEKNAAFQCLCTGKAHANYANCPQELVYFLNHFRSVETFYVMVSLDARCLRDKPKPSRDDVWALMDQLKANSRKDPSREFFHDTARDWYEMTRIEATSHLKEEYRRAWIALEKVKKILSRDSHIQIPKERRKALKFKVLVAPFPKTDSKKD